VTDPARQVLVLRYHSLGDVILTTGIVRALATRVGAPVDVATERRFSPVFQGNDAVGRLWERRELEEAARRPSPPAYEAVFDLQATAGSRRLCSRLGPTRVLRRRALARRWIVFWGDRFPRPKVPHAIERYAETAGLPGERPLPEATVTPEEEEQALRAFPRPPGAEGPTAALVVGASRRSKTYPPERFAEVGSELERRGWQVWWIEDPDAGPAATSDGGSQGGGPRAGTPVALPLGPLKALLARADLVITGDSGPMHLATALDVPVLAIFGSSVAGFGFTPVGRSRVVEVEGLACRPCGVHGRDRCWLGHWRCLQSLSPRRIVEEAERMRLESRIATPGPAPVSAPPIVVAVRREAPPAEQADSGGTLEEGTETR
jgi:heptosyltransferase-2